MKTIASPNQTAINLNPFVLDAIKQNHRTLAFQPPLSLKPKLDEDDEPLLVIEEKALNLHIYAPTHEQLRENLVSELFFLWDEYANEPTENLTLKAQQIKANLLARCKEH
ncbi:hypothetical protein CRENPOLYSF2_3790003 [Crenothrix polyspora]|uniref:Uncharacterized protein n=1 Tax=Crenothrix polyspora TaxID=360316 RepID=A0A1R4HD36_9GAMM|nr:hypothetical protein [Crenothrix polyspora]SJM94158.1 hypothetical protein CRENPOLYSF2_3790003 [Crenothrix polyspora]